MTEVTPAASPIQFIHSVFRQTAAAHERFASDSASLVAQAAEVIYGSLRRGGKLIAFGNGGSASDAQHLVAELVGRFEANRKALAAVAITADSSVLTAIANDYDYASVFVRQLEGLGQAGDVAFGISTSGRSANVLRGFEVARQLGMLTIALSGRGGGALTADVHLNVAEESTARIQEVHRTIMHAICSLIDMRVTGEAP
jgi:D-sedoheptulose 7-phosphate isomerase